jgi:hypothetical protein
MKSSKPHADGLSCKSRRSRRMIIAHRFIGGIARRR